MILENPIQQSRLYRMEIGSPTVSDRFRDTLLEQTHRSIYFQHNQVEKNVYFYSQSLLMVKGRLI
jgi:hypothetical protein